MTDSKPVFVVDPSNPTDDELVAAIERGLADGSLIDASEWLACNRQERMHHAAEILVDMGEQLGYDPAETPEQHGRRMDTALTAHREPAPAPAVISNGSVVRYRTMGKATVRFHECPAEHRCERPGTQLHQYLVHFRTGRYAGTSRRVWLAASDVIEGR